MSALFGGGKKKVPYSPKEDKAAKAQAELMARLRKSKGYQSTILSDMANAGTLKQYTGA